MKVRFGQSGGYAGLLKGCEIDTAHLPLEQAQELLKLVKASAISASGEFLSNSSRDLHQYEITIEEGGAKKAVIFDDESLPAAAKPLVGFLKKCAKPDSGR
jgi:hypothetical protein